MLSAAKHLYKEMLKIDSSPTRNGKDHYKAVMLSIAKHLYKEMLKVDSSPTQNDKTYSE